MKEGTLKELNVKVGDKVRPIRNSFGTSINGKLLVLTSVDHLYAHYRGHRADREESSWQFAGVGTIFRLEEEAMEIKVGDEVLYDDGLDTILCKVLAAQNYWVVINYQGGRPWVVNRADVSKSKPKPVVEEVVINGGATAGVWGFDSILSPCVEDTHKITFNLVDGEPDCNSIKMFKL